MPRNQERIIVGMDIGTTKICTVVAEVGRGNDINVLGAGIAQSQGLSKGMVVDIPATVRSIALSVERAERLSGCKIGSAYVGVAGNHVTCLNNRGMVAVSRIDRIITEEDVKRVLEAARAIAVPQQREVLHVIPRSFVVDGHEGVREPLGMAGFRLEVETHIVTGAITALQTLMRCVQRAGVEVDDLILHPLASAEAVLTEQEKQLGVALVDIGGGTTDVAVFIESGVWHTSVLPVGGYQMTNDLSVVLQVPFDAAEGLKLQHGRIGVKQGRHKSNGDGGGRRGDIMSADAVEATRAANGVDNQLVQAQLLQILEDVQPVRLEDFTAEEYVDVDTFETGRKAAVPSSLVSQILEARLEEMFLMVGAEIKRSGYDGLLPAGVVLTGGVAVMPGVAELASRVLRMPVRISSPQGLGGMSDSLNSPAYATGAGLALLASRRPDGVLHTQAHVPPSKRESGGGDDAMGRVRRFLREFLP